MTPDQLRTALQKECWEHGARLRVYGRAHIMAAAFYDRIQLVLGLPTAILAAIAGFSGLLDNALLAGAIALVVACLSAAATFVRPGQRVTDHTVAARGFSRLFQLYFDLARIQIPSASSSDLPALRKKVRILEEQDEVRLDSRPFVSERFMKRAGDEWEIEKRSERFRLPSA